MDIGMLVAGGIYFGLDAFAIFKDIAGFAGAINATTPEELVEAGEHLASAVAKIGVDAVMTLLTKKVADRVAGVDEPGTTTGDMDDINHSIRTHNKPTNDRSPYTVEDIGNEITNNSVASKAYQRINDEGYDVRLNYDIPEIPEDMGLTRRGEKNVEIYQMNNRNNDEAVGTMVHESTHVEYRHKKRRPYNSQYEEYRAFVREEIYHRSKDPDLTNRPSLEERQAIWQKILRLYPELPQGKYPFGGSK